MILTHENYYEPSMEYMSSTIYKEFCGILGRSGCQVKSLEKLRGNWIEEPTNAMIEGSYVDAHFSGNMDVFRAKNPDIFTQKGELKAQYKKMDVLIQRIERDSFFMSTLAGQKQVIMTAEMFGCKWKCYIDSYAPGKFITDLKTSGDFMKAYWIKDLGYINFIQYWGYDIQMAIYQKIVEINTGKKLPCFISVVSKDDFPDIEVIQIGQRSLDDMIIEVENNMPFILALIKGDIQPDRCERCDYCKHTKVLTKPILSSNLILNFEQG